MKSKVEKFIELSKVVEVATDGMKAAQPVFKLRGAERDPHGRLVCEINRCGELFFLTDQRIFLPSEAAALQAWLNEIYSTGAACRYCGMGQREGNKITVGAFTNTMAQIDEFGVECENQEKTDVDAAWILLRSVRNKLDKWSRMLIAGGSA